MVEGINIKNNLMESGNINKLVLKFAIPCVIAMVISALYNIVDQIFIGQGVGYVGNAATNVAFPVVILAQGVSLLLGDGAAVFYSIKLGEKRENEGAESIGNAVMLLFLVSIVFVIIAYSFFDEILWTFGATNTNYQYASEYMKILIISLPFTIIMCGLNSIIRADGSPQYGMFALIIGTVINLVLDPLFIFAFKMGVEGAAIATVIGEAVSCAICLNYLNHFKNINFNIKLLKLNLDIVKKILIFGLSSFITQAAVMVLVAVSNNALTKYGALSLYGSDIPLSSVGIVMKVNDLLIGIVIGIAAGSQPITGYNYGAKNYDRVKETYFVIIKIATVVSVIGFIIFQFFPQSIINLFGQNNELYNEFALKSFRVFLMLCMFIGFELTTCIFFQSIGQPIKALILTLCKQTLFIVPLMIILPKYFGVEGVLYAGTCAEVLSVIVTFILIRGQLKKLNNI